MHPSVQPGQVIDGRYRVERVLSAGSSTLVVAAVHTAVPQRVVLRILPAEWSQDPERSERFMSAARLLSRTTGVHFPQIFDAGRLDSGELYQVMEHLDGQTLADELGSGGALGVEQAVGWVLEACEALSELHEQGGVHRGLTTSNLFLARTPGGAVTLKVLGFSVVKDAALDITGSHAVMGAPLYMSPEQLRSSRDVDGRADLWALGVILYELLAASRPFAAETMPQLCMAIVSDPPLPLGDRRRDLPPGLESVVLQALAKEPGDRPASVEAWAERLRPFSATG